MRGETDRREVGLRVEVRTARWEVLFHLEVQLDAVEVEDKLGLLHIHQTAEHIAYGPGWQGLVEHQHATTIVPDISLVEVETYCPFLFAIKLLGAPANLYRTRCEQYDFVIVYTRNE